MKDFILALIGLLKDLLGPFLTTITTSDSLNKDIANVEAANKAAADNRKLSTEERLKDAEKRGLYRD